MKCVVIAAGYATRLGELTKNFPKPLLKIGENTILGRMLDDIDRIPEIDEHIIITNHKFASIFEEWAKTNTIALQRHTPKGRTPHSQRENPTDGKLYEHESHKSNEYSCNSSHSCSKYKKPITIVDDGTETNDTRLGAVCDLLYAMDKLHIDDDLLVVAADNLLFFSFQELDANNKVLGMEEKPQEPKSHWAVPPFYIYLKKDLDLVRHSVENGCGKDAPGNLAHYMVEHTTMHAWPMSAGRFDIGSLDTYYEAVEKYGK